MRRRNPLIFVVDDDDAFRKSLERLLKSIGFNVEMFSTADGFLKRKLYVYEKIYSYLGISFKNIV